MFRIRLKELRESKGLSQYAFAKKIGVAQSTVGGWEAGKREPNFEMVQKIADYFGVTADYLIGRTSEKKPTNQSIEEITLTEEDQADISRDFERIKERLENADGLMLDGDELTPEARESILSSIRTGMELAVLQIKKEKAAKALAQKEKEKE